MIKRVLKPEEFKVYVNQIFDLFKEENEKEGHHLLKHNRESIIKAFAHESILSFDFFCWVSINNNLKVDAMIAFVKNKNEKFGEIIFSEYIWLSKNPKMGFKLLVEALKFARQNDFKYITINRVVKNRHFERLGRFYEKMGFLKDHETYIAKL